MDFLSPVPVHEATNGGAEEARRERNHMLFY